MVSVTISADEPVPPIPTTAQIAKLLGIEEKLVSAAPRNRSKNVKEKLWDSLYKISSKQLYQLRITVYPDGFLPLDHLERSIEKNSQSQKIERDDGDIVYFGPEDEDGPAVLGATLFNHENDWDMSLILLGRDTGVDAPFATMKRWPALIGEIESLLRTGRAEQASVGDAEEAP